MSDTAHFKVFCLEQYKNRYNLKGREAFQIFKEYGVLDYINNHYGILHSYGAGYLVRDIDEFITTRRMA